MLDNISPMFTFEEDHNVWIPPVSKWLVSLFSRYVRHYMSHSFHAVRLAHEGKPHTLPEVPVIVYVNHPSWWDPLFCIVIAKKLFPDRNHYAPMDAAALRRYKFFRKLGFFGIEPESLKGARSLLKVGGAILNRKNSMLWITPQGRFADPRIQPLNFRPGLGHLVHRAAHCALLPIALEYPFWEERFPEALARCGEIILSDKGPATKANDWTNHLERQLETVQRALAADATQRNADAFETLLSGHAGVGGLYDVWRSIRAKLRGETFRAEHGEHHL